MQRTPSQPSPHLSSHQPSAAPEREGKRVEVTELRFGAQRRKRLIISHLYPLTSMSVSLYASIERRAGVSSIGVANVSVKGFDFL